MRCERDTASSSLRVQFMSGFWDKVKVGKRDECWPWQGETWRGYGRYWLNGKRRRAHRIAFLLAYGGFDPSLKILHRCDNPPCCNPRHLFAGTQKDNVTDMIRKGRSVVVGVSHSRYVRGSHVKLDDAEVREIKASNENNRTWARRLGVSESSVSRARRGLAFKEAT